MQDLTFSFSLTPALIATVVVYDLALVALAMLAIRRLRARRATAADAPSGPRLHVSSR